MQEITKEFLKELLETQRKLKKMYDKLEEHIHSSNRWEEENIGREIHRDGWIHGDITRVSLKNRAVEIESFGYDDFYERDIEYWFPYPLDKLLSDDWKEIALKEYQKKQNALRKEKEAEAARKATEKERKERAEYERLKAKFEGLEDETYERV